MEKLVRKGVPGIMRKNGEPPHHVRKATAQEHPGLMADKVIEETLEVIDAINAGDREKEMEEFGDLQQSVRDFMTIRAFTPEELATIEEKRLKKLEERGGFTEGVVVEFPGESRFG